MNLKKIALTVAGVAFSLSIFAGSAAAASGWAICTPKKVGPEGSSVILQVQNCNADPTGGSSLGFMTLQSATEDQQLAVILTAMSLGKTVAVKYNDAQKSGGKNIVLGVNVSN